VVGAGAVGASTARHLAQRNVRVLVLEKESEPARHQSGRNSGVIHAGYNPKPDTEKARYCMEGNRELRAYCELKGIPMVLGGILVVARDAKEIDTLRVLEERAVANGASVRMLDAADILQVEPNARGVSALHALDGGSFDAVAYVRALEADATQAGATFVYDCRVRDIREDGGSAVVLADGRTFRSRVVVSAAGLFADELARTTDLRVIPFRGYYAELVADRRGLVRSHIYAAPDLTFPFLGVHLSRRADGRVIIGPGAMLAFGREAYTFWSFRGGRLGRTLGWRGFWSMMIRPEFRRLIRSEVVKSLSLRAICREARLLVPDLRPRDLVRSFAGNRAQVVDRDGRLVDDIVVRDTDHVIHVLNAVSPGLTCSLPFGRHLADRAEGKL
jgi:L-2-hydroxyglutarate oxidase